MKNIIREVSPEWMDTSMYFDDDGIRDYDGKHFNYNLFIVYSERYNRYSGVNIEAYKNVMYDAERLINDFEDVGTLDYDGNTITFKAVMLDHGISYNPTKCHRLKEWYENADIHDTDCIAEYLTIITGEEWTTTSAHGYCQGDYVEIVYCKSRFDRKTAIIYGEVYLGACKEFIVTSIDDNGEEIDSVGGFFVADSQVNNDDDYKILVCEWDGLELEETTLELIDGYSTQTIYSYKAI